MNYQNEIVEEALSWVGTKYHSGANIKGVAVDCGQILIEVYGNVGVIDKFDTGAYAQDWNLHRSEEKYLSFINQYCTRVEKPQIGDICLYKFGRCISHSGIIVDEDLNIVHALIRIGVTISHYLEGNLEDRFFGFYRLNKLL